MITSQMPDPANADAMVQMMSLRDQALLDAAMDNVLSEWFYELEGPSGEAIEGVSAAGAMEFARLRASFGYPIRFPLDGIRIEDDVMHAGEKGVRAIVIARDNRSGQDAIGEAFYPYFPLVMDDRGQEKRVLTRDQFADRKAISVAQRNAILDLVGEAFVKKVLSGRKKLIVTNEAALKREVKAARNDAISRRRSIPLMSAAAAAAEAPDPYDLKPTLQPAAPTRQPVAAAKE